jgi:hypothetical protein
MRDSHVHKYKRVDAGVNKKYIVYSCADPDCPRSGHYLIPKLVIGKKSRCCSCDDEFVMTSKSATLTNPKCLKCSTGSGIADVVDLVSEMLEGKIK